MTIDLILDACFAEFRDWLHSHPDWRAKENDCVNLFAHRFLLARVKPGTLLHDPCQICIEVGVAQPPGWGNKPSVRRDLVIWSEPAQYTWDETWTAVRAPMAIVEWKARRKRSPTPLIFPYDLDWLTQYGKANPGFTGYCATVDFATKPTTLEVCRAC